MLISKQGNKNIPMPITHRLQKNPEGKMHTKGRWIKNYHFDSYTQFGEKKI